MCGSRKSMYVRAELSVRENLGGRGKERRNMGGRTLARSLHAMPCLQIHATCLGDCTLHPASQSLRCAAVPLTAITDQRLA
jgi:hypothetical protein